MTRHEPRVASLAVCALLLAGCGGKSPTAPSTESGGGLPFEAKRYEFQIVGDPSRCTGDVRATPLVTLGVNLTADATGWTARPDDPANGTTTSTCPSGAALWLLRVPTAS